MYTKSTFKEHSLIAGSDVRPAEPSRIRILMNELRARCNSRVLNAAISSLPIVVRDVSGPQSRPSEMSTSRQGHRDTRGAGESRVSGVTRSKGTGIRITSNQTTTTARCPGAAGPRGHRQRPRRNESLSRAPLRVHYQLELRINILGRARR